MQQVPCARRFVSNLPPPRELGFIPPAFVKRKQRFRQSKYLVQELITNKWQSTVLWNPHSKTEIFWFPCCPESQRIWPLYERNNSGYVNIFHRKGLKFLCLGKFTTSADSTSWDPCFNKVIFSISNDYDLLKRCESRYTRSAKCIRSQTFTMKKRTLMAFILFSCWNGNIMDLFIVKICYVCVCPCSVMSGSFSAH